MNQKCQRGFVGPMKVLKYVQLRMFFTRAPRRVGNTLEKIAALLRQRQFQWLRNIRKNSPEGWSDLDQFGRVVSHPPTEIIQARRLSEVAFNDLREREKGKRFVSFVTVPDQVSEANAPTVLRHLHPQACVTHPQPPPQ